MTTQEIQQYFYDFMHDKGLPHSTICAIMGNITGESSWDPSQIEQGNSIGFGLCQWSFGRRTQLEAYGTDLQHQCEFLWSELTGENLAITGADFQWLNPPALVVSGVPFDCSIARFKAGSDTIEFLTSAFCFCWERPALATNHLNSLRIPAAKDFLNTMSYKNNGTTNPSNPNPSNPSTSGIKVGDKVKLITFKYYDTNFIFTKYFSAKSNDFTITKITPFFVEVKNNTDNKLYKVKRSNLK